MKITTQSTYKKDIYYKAVVSAFDEILKKNFVVSPVEVLIQMQKITKKDFEDWRFGRIPYLERVMNCNLSKANRILRIINLHAEALKLKPSFTAYRRWGKGPKQQLYFTKSRNHNMETLYATHYVSQYLREKMEAEKAAKEVLLKEEYDNSE